MVSLFALGTRENNLTQSYFRHYWEKVKLPYYPKNTHTFLQLIMKNEKGMKIILHFKLALFSKLFEGRLMCKRASLFMAI